MLVVVISKSKKALVFYLLTVMVFRVVRVLLIDKIYKYKKPTMIHQCF